MAFDDAAGITKLSVGWTPAAMTVAAAAEDSGETTPDSLPACLVTLDSGVTGLGFVIFCTTSFETFAFPLETLLATLFAMLETRASVLLSCC